MSRSRSGRRPPARAISNVDAMLAAARAARADAVHPGYGFLAENPRFAEARPRRRADLGRPAAQDDRGHGRQGARAPAREGRRRAGPARAARASRPHDVSGPQDEAERVGYPAPGQGGGRRRRHRHAAGRQAGGSRGVVEATQAMAERAFGDGTVYLERLVAKARHIEIQVFGFGDGHAVHLYERECSMQRRFQKIIEETPAPGLPDETRQRHGPGGRGARRAGALSRRRHGRVRRRRRDRRLLFPRDEHPHPGRASGDRDDHRDRSGRRCRSGSPAATISRS